MQPEVSEETLQQVMPKIDSDGGLFLPLKQNIDPQFKISFDQGVKSYLDGKWDDAKTCLEKSNGLKSGGDKPSQLLLKVMARYEYRAPKTWRGFRALTSKT